MTDNIWRPEKLGDLGMNYIGTRKWLIEHGQDRDPDFGLNYINDPLGKKKRV